MIMRATYFLGCAVLLALYPFTPMTRLDRVADWMDRQAEKVFTDWAMFPDRPSERL